MNSTSRILLLSTLSLLLPGGVLLLIGSGATTQAGATASEEAPAPVNEEAVEENVSQRASPISDKPLAAFQVELLDIAFRTATKLPVRPHLKTRSRMQEEVAATCFELDQPRRALHYIENIADWRRGTGYADFGFYCAEHGDTTEVQRYLDLALEVAEGSAKEENSQDWQIDRIRVAVAKAHVALGNLEEANRLQAGTADFEAEKVRKLEAALLDAEAFDAELAGIVGLRQTATFDQLKSALETCAQLFDRFYADSDKRAQAEAMIKASWTKLPLMIRIELMFELTEFALGHRDLKTALALVDETFVILESAPWLPEDHIPLLARLAGLRHRAGDVHEARSAADATLSMFQDERTHIESFRRGAVLRPLAEAYQTMGDARASLSVYKQAVEEGSLNPNARARAEDLTATCRSMALHGVEPDAEVLARIRLIHDGLSDPW